MLYILLYGQKGEKTHGNLNRIKALGEDNSDA